MKNLQACSVFVIAALSLCACAGQQIKTAPLTDTKLSSLSDLTIDALRARAYSSEIKLETKLDIECVDRDAVLSLPDADTSYQSYMASYSSDGLRVYARLNIPEGPVPENGFPTIVFAHGWVGAEAAPSYTLGCDPESMYSENTDAYARAGYAVVIPGYRGHATVDTVPGDGIEFMHAWDNGSYLSPIFYAIDVMNLIAGLDQGIDDPLTNRKIDFDVSDLKLAAHSQGGDVALTVLAATGEGAQNGIEIAEASIWSGTFPDRFTQLRTYHAMQKTPEAFLAGDGSWNGTAIGAKGEVNPNFVFGYPRDWIETPNPSEWTWQKETFNLPGVLDAAKEKLDQMYASLNMNVADLGQAKYEIEMMDDGSFDVVHDQKVLEIMPKIGGFNFPQNIQEPLILHFPDRDYSSFPEWNVDLCNRINGSGGQCATFEYAENTHGMRVGKHEWHSSETAVSGYAAMVARDIAHFLGEEPSNIPFP